MTLTRPSAELVGAAAHQAGILERMGVAVDADPPDSADVTLDALIGYSLQGAPRGRTAALIDRVRGAGNVIALDTPSGLDVTSAEVPGEVVDAAVTLTLALPKRGLRHAPSVGRLLLADISVPRSVTDPLGGAPAFRLGPILEIRRDTTDAQHG